MQIQLSRVPDATLYEVKFGKKEIPSATYYLSKSIGLPHGERILFDGYITKYKGKEADFFHRFFKDFGIRDLLEEAQSWDGCWSIVYINANGVVYCFTDPLGKKQLYYNKRGDICSLIWPIRGTSDLDPLYLGEIHKWGYNVDDLTPFRDVKRVMPNKLYMFVGGVLQNLEPQRYFDFRWGSSFLDPSGFRALVSHSVEEHLSDITGVKSIAVLLSGGIDSSIISYELLRLKESGRALKGVNLNFYTINNREDAPFVKIFAETFGIKVKTLSYDMSHVNLVDAMKINETPVDLGSMVPNQKMFAAIPEKVIFTGDGPDEMFGGYRRIDEYDSQKSDVFHELAFYHCPRLEKAATYYGKDLRCPWLSYDILRYALSLPFKERKHKACIKKAYQGLIPQEIIDRPKLPLKNDELREDPMKYRKKLLEKFEELNPTRPVC